MGNVFSRFRKDVKLSFSTNSKLLILVIGGPCSGKSSICQHLSSQLHLTTISPDHLIRECVDQESLRKPEVRMEHLHKRRLRTYNALLIHNKMTKEEKEFLGKVGEPIGINASRNHFSLHRQSDSDDDDCLHCPSHVRDIQNSLKRGEPIDPECIAALIHDAMQSCVRKCNGFVVDGYPRDLEQSLAFSEMIGEPHVIVFLECPDDVMISRAIARAQASQRYDDNEPFLKMRIALWQKNLAHLTQEWTEKGIFILNVNGTDSLEDVKEECLLQVHNKISGQFRIKKFRVSKSASLAAASSSKHKNKHKRHENKKFESMARSMSN